MKTDHLKIVFDHKEPKKERKQQLSKSFPSILSLDFFQVPGMPPLIGLLLHVRKINKEQTVQIWVGKNYDIKTCL